jgi:hypothetical protein
MVHDHRRAWAQAVSESRPDARVDEQRSGLSHGNIVWWLVGGEAQEWWRRIDNHVNACRPFAVGVVMQSEELFAKCMEGESSLRRWVRPQRASIGTWCCGIAYVVPSPSAPRRWDRIGDEHQWLWGCPVRVLGDVTSANAWLAERLREAGYRRSLRGAGPMAAGIER